MHALLNRNRNQIVSAGGKVDLWKLKSEREGTRLKHVQQKETPMKEKKRNREKEQRKTEE